MSEKHFWKYRLYTLAGFLILAVTMVSPHVYTVEDYEDVEAEAMVANIYGVRQDIVGKMRVWGEKIPKAKITFGNWVLSFNGLPIWHVVLDAPQYPRTAFPEGLSVNVYFIGPKNACKNTECLREIDTVAHYIGMEPLVSVAPIEKKIAPYFFIIFAAMIIIFNVYTKKVYGWLLLIPMLTPFIYAIDYSFWLHWLGFHLHEWAAIKVRPFTPMVFGVGKSAQFTVKMNPTIGFALLLVSSTLFFLAYMSKRKAIIGSEEEILLSKVQSKKSN